MEFSASARQDGSTSQTLSGFAFAAKAHGIIGYLPAFRLRIARYDQIARRDLDKGPLAAHFLKSYRKSLL
jgi:hypothetical protein